MATAKKQTDPSVQRILDVLQQNYQQQHPKSKIKVYRQTPYSIRIRIIDPDFRGVNMMERDPAVWTILDALPEAVQREIGLLLLLSPEETKTSMMNIEFDNPTPSMP
jgi:hypothetical protein